MAMLKELKSQHRNIVQMAFNGYKNNEIAERLGMAVSSVSIILRSPLGQAYLGGLQDRAQEATLDVRKKLLSLNKSALDTFERLLDPKQKAPHSVQYNAAKDVLDRNGYKAPDRLSIDMTLQTKTDEELDAEIAAIEASINRHNRPNDNNLPEIKTQPVETSSDSPNLSDLSDFQQDPELDSALSLEDYNFDDAYELEESLNFDSVDSESEVDPDLLEGLPIDLFKVS